MHCHVPATAQSLPLKPPTQATITEMPEFE